MIAYCGLSCETCPIRLATRQEDKEEQVGMRIEILRLLREQYGMNLEFRDITDCDGCQTDEQRLFSQCKNCRIRQCARAKKLRSCAYCPEYSCENLEAFFRTDPSARVRLDAMRTSGS